MPNDFPSVRNGGEGRLDDEDNSFGGSAGSFFAPGRIIEEVERYHLPSGRTRELRRMIRTVQDGLNTWRTASQVEATPPFDCSCVPVDMTDIAECSNPECLAIVCGSRHSFTCQACGKVHCTACGIADGDGYFRICRACYRELRTPWIFRWLRRIFWGE